MTIQTYSVTSTLGNAYTSSGNTAITSLTICNWGALAVTANLFVVPNSATPDTTNIVLSNISIPSNETAQLYTFAEKILLGPGDMIQIDSSANTLTAVTSYTSL